MSRLATDGCPSFRPQLAKGGGFSQLKRIGQFSSLQLGLQEVLNRGRDSAIVTLVDRPAPGPQTIRRLCDVFLQDDPARVWGVVPRYQERNGHPIIVGRELIAKFLSAPAIGNARDILRNRQDKIEFVEVNDPLVISNVDTPSQYDHLVSNEQSPKI